MHGVDNYQTVSFFSFWSFHLVCFAPTVLMIAPTELVLIIVEFSSFVEQDFALSILFFIYQFNCTTV